jgi:hypothetical protein
LSKSGIGRTVTAHWRWREARSGTENLEDSSVDELEERLKEYVHTYHI